MAEEPKVYQLKISLNYIQPPIWRRFQVRSSIRLTSLHEVIQTVMGWEDYHLYCFDLDGVEYTDPESIEEDIYDLGHQDGSKVRLADALTEVGDRCLYRYDFGDNWEHTIELEEILDPEPGEQYPVCIDGERACPREDCGGIGGYAELVHILAHPRHREYKDMRMWAGKNWDPEKFDRSLVNQILPRRVITKSANSAGRPATEPVGRRLAEEGRTWMTDITHFLDQNGQPPARRQPSVKPGTNQNRPRPPSPDPRPLSQESTGQSEMADS